MFDPSRRIGYQTLSDSLANDHLPRVSRLSANNNGDNEMIPEAVHRSPGIYLTTEENPEKPQLGNRLMKAVQPVIATNEVPYLQMRSIELHREKQGKDEDQREKEGEIIHVH